MEKLKNQMNAISQTEHDRNEDGQPPKCAQALGTTKKPQDAARKTRGGSRRNGGRDRLDGISSLEVFRLHACTYENSGTGVPCHAGISGIHPWAGPQNDASASPF